MRDTNKLYTKESPGQFDDQRAEVVRKNLITQADNMGQFNAFLAKFRNSILVNEDEKPSREGILEYMTGNPKDAPVNGQFPTDGLKIT